MPHLSWLPKTKPVPAWLRQFTRLCLQVVLWGGGLTVLLAILIAVVVQDPQSISVRLWLDNARFSLLAWRLVLYTTLAGLWFGGLRRHLVSQINVRCDWRARASLRRLELMTIALVALSEYNVWLAPH
ncbi:hypothetical protein [Salmonella enterica]|uniref:Uncharacterized protein n=2 Tax=Salmonella enterica TaxID=28901 RepID=A0A379QHH1_SALER|nr:hypothetical protein [Salmonella enterica]ECC1658148.1 hypothetical protein [Salmonella enterica subsp. salamae]ASG86845.1 hypothetical protein LFZ47_04210 [Salmonella enterica subsp. salamae serovar 55:k:z39 str. 1315K]ECD9415847.1 hypothetical protein [Salmonella enterica subsp. salamae]ECF5932706.1 hypothetical protein [Salmonella enterica subsp. salamae]ECG1251618.1 hypothetical protein [Salmonella enterica subsp. salamae]